MRNSSSRKLVVLWSLVASVALGTPALSSADPVQIISRNAWDAKPAITERTPPIKLVSTGKKLVAAENVMPLRGEAKYLTIHHTGRMPSRKELKQNLQEFQKQMFHYVIEYGQGKSKHIYLGDIPYHYFIDWTGAIGEGRELTYAAYSNTKYSTPIENHVTVVLDGNFEKDVPTNAQIASLINLLERNRSLPPLGNG
jgi:hypothetical protein